MKRLLPLMLLLCLCACRGTKDLESMPYHPLPMVPGLEKDPGQDDYTPPIPRPQTGLAAIPPPPKKPGFLGGLFPKKPNTPKEGQKKPATPRKCKNCTLVYNSTEINATDSAKVSLTQDLSAQGDTKQKDKSTVKDKSKVNTKEKVKTTEKGGGASWWLLLIAGGFILRHLLPIIWGAAKKLVLPVR